MGVMTTKLLVAGITLGTLAACGTPQMTAPQSNGAQVGAMPQAHVSQTGFRAQGCGCGIGYGGVFGSYIQGLPFFGQGLGYSLGYGLGFPYYGFGAGQGLAYGLGYGGVTGFGYVFPGMFW